MCNRLVQDGRVIRPGERARVLLKGPGGEFEIPFEQAVFSGCAREKSKGWWKRTEGGEEVVVPVEGFEEKHELTKAQTRESLPPGSRLDALLLAQPPGKDYRLLKIVTRDATAPEFEKFGNSRIPVFFVASPGPVGFPPEQLGAA